MRCFPAYPCTHYPAEATTAYARTWNAPLLLSSSRKVGKRNYKPDARRYNSSELPPCFRLLCGCSLGPTTRGVRISLFSSWLRRLLSPAGAGAVRLVRPASPPTPHSPQPTSFNFLKDRFFEIVLLIICSGVVFLFRFLFICDFLSFS